MFCLIALDKHYFPITEHQKSKSENILLGRWLKILRRKTQNKLEKAKTEKINHTSSDTSLAN